MIERDRDIEYARLNEMAENLAAFKREAANCDTTARVYRENEHKSEMAGYRWDIKERKNAVQCHIYIFYSCRLDEEAEEADREAEEADREAEEAERDAADLQGLLDLVEQDLRRFKLCYSEFSF